MFYMEAEMEAVTSTNTNQVFSISVKQILWPIRKVLNIMMLITVAIVLFEIFNFSTTEHALTDAMGELGFLGIRLATILALAFCGIDFAGVARLFSREEAAGQEREEEWYLLAAWLMAGMMNALMTWWSVSETLLAQPNLGNELLTRQTMITYIPIFVAGAVWMIRILLIGAVTLHVKKPSRILRPISPRESILNRSGKMPAGPLRSIHPAR
jgi:hypothetical protein